MRKRGDVYWINFNPSVGNEIKNRRPALIISNDKENKKGYRYQVIPMTSNVKKLYAGEAIIDFMGGKSKIAICQLTTVSKERLGKRIGTLSKNQIEIVERVIIRHLDLPMLAEEE